MSPETVRPRLLVAVLALVLMLQDGRCAVESHSAAGLHRSGLLPLTPLQTVPAGPTLARRAHCLARCVRRADCVSFNYGQLPDGTAGCQLLGKALCQAGGGFSELQRDAGVNYFDVYRGSTVGAAEMAQAALWTECETTGRCAVPLCQPVAGDYCTSSAVCAASITNAQCTSSTCQCTSDHWLNSPTECLPGVAIGAACTQLIECQTITSGSECSSGGLCACPAGTWHNPDGSCLPVKALGEACSVDPECGDETTTYCSSAVCTCRANYVAVNGVCEPGKAMGAACTISAECTMVTANTACTSGVCACASGYWNNGGTCRQSVPFGGACTYQEDCSSYNSKFICSGGTCGDFGCTPVIVSGYEYRLAGGDSSCLSGRVEVRPQGAATWGQVCDDGWGTEDATVFCRSIGRTGGTATCCSPHWYATGAVFHMDDLACAGTESHLLACPYSGWNVENCGDGEVASATCT
ncbi:antigen WC1.1-like [Amphibalanus amphitrite]|uniref:antigen WC1.1-like n=1 Tax=Amphibalanus amphitrite TaxID=1232801 RepID=UPI001C90ED8A|nr:antigen WC1.1-like [Amphibalanus amphitrite]